MLRMSYEGCGGSEVDLRAFYCEARGGGGRLRQATETEGKKKRRERRRGEKSRYIS